MDWTSVKEKLPDVHKEVIVATNEGRVKSAIYMGNGKWNTFLSVTHWMLYPTPPSVTANVVVDASTPVEAPKKKRGRPKKV